MVRSVSSAESTMDQEFSSLTQPSLWDAQQPESGWGGEGKSRLFSTDWILKLIAKASVMLRKYRKRNLQRMEGGMSPVTPEEAELFDEIGEVMTMFNDPAGGKT